MRPKEIDGLLVPPDKAYMVLTDHLITGEACIGYFGIWDIGLFVFKGYWDICVFYFGIWDIQEFRDMGYWNLFWDRFKLILGYGIFWTVYFGIWDIALEISRTPDSAPWDEKTWARTHNSAKK